MQPSYMKRVLIIDANQRSALAVTRSLGKQNVPLITADESQSALAGSSRYSQQYFTYPSPQVKPEQFSSAIAELCKNENISIVIPMTELTTSLLLKHKASSPAITMPFPEIDTVNILANKCSLMRLAESINIPVPNTWYADNPLKLPIDLNELSYPLILKPGKSWLEYNGKWHHTSVKIADNPASAAEILKTDPSFNAHPFILQEYIPGKGGGVFALYENGKPIAFFAHRRLREKPPRGGVSVLSESVALDSTLRSYAHKLLDHVYWHGVAMVEFRITPNGEPYLMEVNTRFWGSLQLAVNAGVDFPWLLYQITSGSQVTPLIDYRTGIRLYWLLGNLDWLYLMLRDSGFSMKEKLMAVVYFLIPSPFKTKFEVVRLTDMRPFWFELKRYFKDLL